MDTAEFWYPRHGDQVLRIALSPSGTRRFVLFQRQDRFFSFGEERLEKEDLHPFGGNLLSYWTPSAEGGLFDSEDVAWEAAISEVPWLKE